MANINLDGGINYSFARSQGNTIILDSENHCHATKSFANTVVISGSNLPFGNTYLTVGHDITFGGTGDRPMVVFSHDNDTTAASTNTYHDFQLAIHNESTTTNAFSGIVFKNGTATSIANKYGAAIKAFRDNTSVATDDTNLSFSVNDAGANACHEIVRITHDGVFRVFEPADTADYFWINNDGNSRLGTSDGNLDIHVDGTAATGDHCARFDSDGKFFLFDLATASSTELHINTGTGEVTIDSSTEKIKKDIVNIPTSSMDAILNLRPVQFKFKSDNSETWGFIAEEAASASANFAVWGPDYEYDASGSMVKINASASSAQEKYSRLSNNIVPQTINDRSIIASLVKKVQDLENRIRTLENN
jgi:hypothetical protein